MLASQRWKSPQILEAVHNLQREVQYHMADPEIQQLFDEKHSIQSASMLSQSSEYLESNSRIDCFDDYEAVYEKINQVKTIDANKNLFDVIEWNATFQRNREKLFKRQRIEQKMEIAAAMKEIGEIQAKGQSQISNNRSSGNLANKRRQYQEQNSNKPTKKQIYLKSNNSSKATNEKLQFRAEDLEKLSPGQDLNDTIISGYLKIMQNYFLSQEYSKRIHQFSTFFFPKLTASEDSKSQNFENILTNQLSRNQIQRIKERVNSNYKKIQRWTKNTDIFEKELLIFPINAFNHWFCVLVLNPYNICDKDNPSEFIYCDSMFEKKDYIIEALKEYLRLAINEKRKKDLKPFCENVFACQMLLPRQTNNHDCGLYMLTYIDQLLKNGFGQTNSCKNPQNRDKLRLFPRMLIFTMRKRLLNLLCALAEANSSKQSQQICEAFQAEKDAINDKNNEKVLFEQINEDEYRKYMATIFYKSSGQNQSSKQQNFCNLIKFNLDSEANYYEKDNQLQ